MAMASARLRALLRLLALLLPLLRPFLCRALEAVADAKLGELRSRVQLEEQRLHSALERRVRGGGGQAETFCSCFLVENPYCCEQTLCTCDYLCYTGSNFVSIGDTVCRDVEEKDRQRGLLKAVQCKEEKWYKRWVMETMEENQRRDIGRRSKAWLKSRKKVVWRAGMTYFQLLGDDTTNIAHFMGRVMYLLLINNSSNPGYSLPVHRFLLPRAPAMLHRMRENGMKGFHITLLRTLLKQVTVPLFGDLNSRYWSSQQHLLMGDNSMAFDRIEFEEAYNDATEERPICFERLVYPGVLKAVSYPGDYAMAQDFTRKVMHTMQLKPDISKDGIRLLWIGRNIVKTAGRRCLVPESAAALKKLMTSLSLEVHEVFMEAISFSEQVREVQEADIIFSIHGAGLTNPGTFGRPESVIIELMPYHTYHPMYLYKSAATGVTHMMHQCRQGPPQSRDTLYSGTNIRACMLRDKKCKNYFTHTRKIELTLEDLGDLEDMLRWAVSFVLDARKGAKAAANRAKGKFKELCVAQVKNETCRESLLMSPLARADVCILKSECP